MQQAPSHTRLHQRAARRSGSSSLWTCPPRWGPAGQSTRLQHRRCSSRLAAQAVKTVSGIACYQARWRSNAGQEAQVSLRQAAALPWCTPSQLPQTATKGLRRNRPPRCRHAEWTHKHLLGSGLRGMWAGRPGHATCPELALHAAPVASALSKVSGSIVRPSIARSSHLVHLAQPKHLHSIRPPRCRCVWPFPSAGPTLPRQLPLLVCSGAGQLCRLRGSRRGEGPACPGPLQVRGAACALALRLLSNVGVHSQAVVRLCQGGQRRGGGAQALALLDWMQRAGGRMFRGGVAQVDETPGHACSMRAQRCAGHKHKPAMPRGAESPSPARILNVQAANTGVQRSPSRPAASSWAAERTRGGGARPWRRAALHPGRWPAL